MDRERLVQSFDGTTLYTAEVGLGPPILFCDGLGCDGFIWKYIRQALKKHYRLIFWHYRGHGRSSSPAHPEAVGIPALKGDLRAVLDAYGVEKAVLVGHSMGVQLSLEVALTLSERVQALILICGSFGSPLDSLHDSTVMRTLLPLVESSLRRFPVAGQALWRRMMMSRLASAYARRFEVNGDIVQAHDFQPYFDHLTTMDTQMFIRLLSRIQKHTVKDRLAHISQPTLIIAGERDSFTPVRLSRHMHRNIRGSHLLVVPGGTHIAPIEVPDLVVMRMERFLADLAGADVVATDELGP